MCDHEAIVDERDEYPDDWYDPFSGRYDDDPSPYEGTYSEE